VTCGVYAEAVHEDDYRDRKIRTVARVGTELLKGEREGDPISVDGPDGQVFDSPFALLVSNNCYELDVVGLPGKRERLDGGQLHVCVVDVDRGSELLGLAATATGRNLEDHPAFHQWLAPTQLVRSDEDVIRAGVDGEATEFVPPICLEVAAGALRILLPTEVAVEIPLD
jgi:diacylglycerol kinase family enzyme